MEEHHLARIVGLVMSAAAVYVLWRIESRWGTTRGDVKRRRFEWNQLFRPKRIALLVGALAALYATAYVLKYSRSERLCMDKPVWEVEWEVARYNPSPIRNYVAVRVNPLTLNAYCEAPAIGSIPARWVDVETVARDQAKYED